MGHRRHTLVKKCNFFFKKSTLDPSFPHCTDAAQRLRPDKSSSAFSKPEIPVCQEHTIQICEKRKMAPCTKNSRNAIRINLFYAEVKRRRRQGWGGGGGGCVTIAGTLDTVTCCTFGWTYKKMFLIAEICLKKGILMRDSGNATCGGPHCSCGMELQMK